MARTTEQKGKPFEAATVQAKSDMRGDGKVALPLVFAQDDEGNWTAKWIHLYLTGHPNFNATENNRVTTALIAENIVKREYLRMRYMIGNGLSFVTYDAANLPDVPFTYVGLTQPEGLPAGTKVITLANLHEIIV